jgi:hypothetical protein
MRVLSAALEQLNHRPDHVASLLAAARRALFADAGGNPPNV